MSLKSSVLGTRWRREAAFSAATFASVALVMRSGRPALRPGEAPGCCGGFAARGRAAEVGRGGGAAAEVVNWRRGLGLGGSAAESDGK